MPRHWSSCIGVKQVRRFMNHREDMWCYTRLCDLKQNDDSSFPIKMKHSAAHSDDPRLLAQQMQQEDRGNLQEHSNA